jgi:DNA-binding MarR family transcriptional regulator
MAIPMGRARVTVASRGSWAEQETEGDVRTVEAACADLHRIWERALEELSSTLTPVQLRALLAIDRSGPLSLNTLAGELHASPSAASKVCDRLQHAGFITRKAARDDRRGVVLSLSRAGAGLVAWVHSRHRERLAAIVESMSADGRAALLTGLRELRDSIRRRT